MHHQFSWQRWIASVFQKASSLRSRRPRSQTPAGVAASVQSLDSRIMLAAGTLDPTFGVGGVVTTELFASSFSSENIVASVAQPDGKIIAVGGSGSIARYNADGSLDSSFGTGGFASFGERATAVALQPDGKIVVAGTIGSSGGRLDFALARFTANGLLDATFSGDGKLTTDIDSLDNTPTSLAIQSDGKIVVAGVNSKVTGTKDDIVLVRYQGDGSLDLSFDGDGKKTTDVSSSRFDYAARVMLLSDGKIMVAGSNYDSGGLNIQTVLIRYLGNGTLDASFDSDGIFVDLTSNSGFVTGAALQGDGKIVAATQGSGDMTLARYNMDGTLDTSFDGDGRVTTDMGSAADQIQGVAVQSDGKIVAVGVTLIGTGNKDFVVTRYNSDGTLDTSFDGDGKVVTEFGVNDDTPTGVMLLGDGSIVVTGGSYNVGRTLFAIARYTSTGSLDASFDTDGKLRTYLGVSLDFAQAIAFQSDGKMIVAGTTQNGTYDVALTRYNQDGSLDLTFGSYGRVIMAFGNSNDSAAALVVQSDGKILVAGTSLQSSTGYDFAIARYNSDGTLDTSFDGDGRVTTSFGSSYDQATSVVLQPDGKIIVGGSANVSGQSMFALARYNSNGSLDTSFDGDGKVTTAVGTTEDVIQSIALQSDGRIVVAGTTYNGSDQEFALARYNSNGALDTTFDGDGAVVTSLGTSNDIARSVAIQSDGRIVVAGYRTPPNGTNSDFVVMRYTDTGMLDSSFEGDGIVTTNFSGTSDDRARSVAIQSDGKIIVAGDSLNGIRRNFAFARYHTNGTLDSSFGADGKLTTEGAMPFSNNEANGLVIQNDGKIVAVGTSSTGNKADFSIVRFQGDYPGSVAISAIDSYKPEGQTGQTSFTFTVTRSGNIGAAATVDYQVTGVGDAATDVADFGGVLPSGTVTFAANEIIKTITINVTGDTKVESNEDFTVTLLNPGGVTIGTATAVVTVLNDDSSVSIAAADASKPEGQSGSIAFTFTVTRTGSVGGPASVEYAVVGVGAVAANAADFGGTLPSGTVDFAANEVSKLITINVSADTLVEGNEAFVVTLSNPSVGTTIATAVAGGLIVNDDFSANVAPVIGAFDTAVTYTENAVPVVLDTNATVVDPDSLNLATGKLTISILTNVQTTDRLSIKSVGTAVNQIGVNGTTVTYGGVAIGTFTGTTTLVVTLNADATPAAVQALLRSITFSSLSENPSILDRMVKVTLTDGDGGTSNSPTKTVKVVAKNDAPVIGAFDTAVTYTENAVPVLLDTNATIVDPDSLDLATGRLTVSITANVQSTDRIGIKHIGTAANQIGVNGTTVTYGGVAIGTFTGTTTLTITLNAAVTPVAVQALLRSITFSSLSENPSVLDRTIKVTLTDGDGGTSNLPTKIVKVVAKNDAPVIGAFDTAVTYTENAVPVVLDTNATIVDPDSLDLSTGRLTVSIIANSQSTDRIGIKHVGTAANQIGVNGTTVTYGGVAIGTFTGTTTLTVTLNASATPVAVQALLRSITFSSVSENPSVLDRTIKVTLNDGDGGTSNSPTKTVKVVAKNDAPVIGAFDTAVTFTENALPVVLDTNATIVDPDSLDLSTGRLTVSIITNMQSTDRIGIKHVGTAANQIGIDGTTVTYGGVAIGTFAGTNTLTVTLNTAATPAAVQALLRSITFSSVSENPSVLDRTVKVALTDGDGGTSNTPTKTVKVAAKNDAPVIGAFDTTTTYKKNAVPVLLDTDATVVDPDSLNLATGKLTVSILANSQTTDRIGIKHVGNAAKQIGVNGTTVSYGGVAIGTFTGTTTLVVTLNADATPAAVQALLRSITYSSVSDNPSTLDRTIKVSLTDGAGGTSNTPTKTVMVVA